MLDRPDPFETGINYSPRENEVAHPELDLLMRNQIRFACPEDRDQFNRQSLFIVRDGLEAKQRMGALTEQYENIDSASPELVDRLQKRVVRGHQAQSAITMANMGIVRRVLVGPYWGTPDIRAYRNLREIDASPAISLEDLFHDGLMALYRAIPQWDPDQSKLFSYVKERVANEIQRKLEKSRPIPIPNHAMTIIRSPESIARVQFGTSQLTDEERELQSLFENSETELLSYIEDRDEDPDEELLRDMAPLVPDVKSGFLIDPPTDITDLLDRQAAVQELEKAKPYFDDREWALLALRFGLDRGTPRTLEEVGGHLNLTRERIRQIEEKALSNTNENVVSERYPDTAPTILRRESNPQGSQDKKAKSVKKDQTQPSQATKPSETPLVLSTDVGSIGDKLSEIRRGERLPVHEGINIYLDALRLFKTKHANDRRRVTFTDFYKEVGIKFTPFFSTIHTTTNLIETNTEGSGPSHIDIKDGSVTPLGAERIINKSSATTAKQVPNRSVVKLQSYITTTIDHQELTPRPKLTEVVTEDKKDLYERVGKLAIEKGFMLMDPETGLIIDPASFAAAQVKKS